MRKKFSGLLVILLFAFCLQAANAGGSSSVQPTASTGAVKPVGINLVLRRLAVASHPDNAYWQALSSNLAKMGITVNIDWYPITEYQAAITTLIASGDYPDMIEWWNTQYPTDLENLSNDGVIRPLNDLIDKYGPNIKKVRTDGTCTWYHNSKDGLIYGIPCRPDDLGASQSFVVRQDWLDEVGMKAPDNPNDFYTMLQKFKEKHPDKIPFGFCNNAASLNWYIVWSAFGITYNQWNINDTGNLEYYTVRDKSKDVITYVRRLYQEGLMEPEFVLMTREILWDKMANGDYGVCIWNTDRLDINNDSARALFNTNFPNVKWQVLQPFPDEKGVRCCPAAQNTQQMLIFKKASDEKAIACVRYCDYLLSNEGGDIADLGVKGAQWDEDANGVAHFLVTPDALNVAGFAMYNWSMKRSQLNKTYDPSVIAITNMLRQSAVSNAILSIVSQGQSRYGSTLSSLNSSAICSMIVDKGVNMDQAFTDYVNKWYSSGGREWTDELNKLYKK